MTPPSDHAKSEQRRARRQPHKATLAEVLDRCPFRTLLGNACGGPDAMMARLGCTVAVLDGDPEPMSQRMMGDVLRELAAMAGPAGGAA